MRALLAVSLFVAVSAQGALPGFRAQSLGATAGFASSIAVDSRGSIYYTTTDGNLFRFVDGQSTVVSHLNTIAGGNSGLLGMALRDDRTAVVHYTTPGQTADVISLIDLPTGSETILDSFICDKDTPQRGSSTEHHGGNPTVGADGSIFVGIGDYGSDQLAADPAWNAGKVFRIFPDGSAQQFARGFRNPFDLAWDAARQRLIVPDNGVLFDDEINIVHEGDFCGWPFTMGNGPPIVGATPPVYTFSNVVAPTGIVAVNGQSPYFRSGYLLGAFVTKALYYIPDIDDRPFPDPIPVLRGDTASIIDVAQAPNGDIFFVTGSAIFKLVVPQRGDCNGDGLVDAADVAALTQELADGEPHPTRSAQNGSFAGSWGCDVDQNGVIDSRDLAALLQIVSIRTRAVGGGGSSASQHP